MVGLLLLYSVVLVGVVVLGLILYARWHVGDLEKMGIPVVERDHFLLGSAMKSYEESGALLDVKMMRKLGTVYGEYHGRSPHLIISDPDLIRAITTKDADSFNGKPVSDYGDPILNEVVEFLPLERWKVVRGHMVPSMSNAVRIKNAHPAMTESIKDYLATLRKDIGEKGNNGKLEKYAVTEGIYMMLTELMARSQYSINIGKSDKSNTFIQTVLEVMNTPALDAPWLANYASAFPFLERFLPSTIVNPEPFKKFRDILKQLMEKREQQNKNGGRPPNKDYMDSVLEWHGKLKSGEWDSVGATEDTVWAMGIMMFLGGQSQISLILGALLYCLADNPGARKRVEKEVDRIFKEEVESQRETLSHEALQELPYLTACVTECTRLYAFVSRTDRVCSKDWEDKERGLKVKKGQVMVISIWGANRNGDYYEDPDSFKPERWLPGNKEKINPYAYTSFGFGPRNCPGKRLSMEIMVLIAAYLIKEFRFFKEKDSKIVFTPGGPYFATYDPIQLDVQIRREE